MQLLKTNCLFFPGLWPHKPLLRQVAQREKLCFESPAFFHLTNIDVTSCFFRQFFRRSTKIRAKNEQFLIANISEILASIELKLHSMFIWFIQKLSFWFILNTFHWNWTKIKKVEILVHLTFNWKASEQLPLIYVKHVEADLINKTLTTRALFLLFQSFYWDVIARKSVQPH